MFLSIGLVTFLMPTVRFPSRNEHSMPELERVQASSVYFSIEGGTRNSIELTKFMNVMKILIHKTSPLLIKDCVALCKRGITEFKAGNFVDL